MSGPGWPGAPFRVDYRRRRAAAALALPQVTTLPARITDATDVALFGSVNPNGNATSAWFAWGTTTGYGTLTPTVALGSGTFPLVTTASLAGLTPGTTYHYVAVAQSPAGLVYGQDVVFVPQVQLPITTIPQVTASTSQVAIGQPHFAFPFKMTVTGAAIQQQDTLDEVLSCVQAIATVPVGCCPELPDFGIPDLVFAQAPPTADELVRAVQSQEPRALESAVSYQVDDAGNVLVRIEGQVGHTLVGE